jgi:pyruvate dehydrogenase E2 component (dihydrolipoamide acetyltransferase)
LFFLSGLSLKSRKFSPSAVISSDLPYHIVVGMPALSPTMETGILAEWYLAEGAEFSAGEAIAKIETDKASIDFEAQDDGFVAKILMEAGSGEDIPVGTPIMVTVEEAADVAAFADFVLESGSPEPFSQPIPAVEKVAAQASPLAPTVAASPAPVHATAEPVLPPAMEDVVAAIAPVLSTGWGDFAKLNSPILRSLSKQQTDYIEKYGTTGQVSL